MLINEQIKQLEQNISILKSNNLALEEQIDLYNNTLNMVAKLQKKLQSLKSSVVNTQNKETTPDASFI